MCRLEHFPFNSNVSGLEYCSIAESNEFCLFPIYCSNCKKTFYQREHLQNHIQSLHEESFNDRGTTNGDESQTIINAVTCQCKCAGFVDNPQVKRTRPNPSMQTPQEKMFETNYRNKNKTGDEVPMKNRLLPNLKP